MVSIVQVEKIRVNISVCVSRSDESVKQISTITKQKQMNSLVHRLEISSTSGFSGLLRQESGYQGILSSAIFTYLLCFLINDIVLSPALEGNKATSPTQSMRANNLATIYQSPVLNHCISVNGGTT